MAVQLRRCKYSSKEIRVIGSGLLLRSVHQVMNAPRGFDGHDVLIAQLLLSPSRYESIEKQKSFFGRLHHDVTAMPGVLHVSATTRASAGSRGDLLGF